jgi:hypothetical protein
MDRPRQRSELAGSVPNATNGGWSTTRDAAGDQRRRTFEDTCDCWESGIGYRSDLGSAFDRDELDSPSLTSGVGGHIGCALRTVVAGHTGCAAAPAVAVGEHTSFVWCENSVDRVEPTPCVQSMRSWAAHEKGAAGPASR